MKKIFENQSLSSEAPQGLRNKVEFAARQRPGRSWLGPKFRWAAAGTAVAAAAIGGVMFMTPARAEAKTWDMVTSAYEQVRGVLIQMSITDESGSGSLTIAGKGNDWRVSVNGLDGGKDERMDISYSRGELTLWDGGDTAQVINLGINIPFTPEAFMQGLTEQLTASKIFEEHADEIGRENIRIEQPVMVNGRRVYNVYITDKENNGRVHVVVDAKTDLPISMTVQDDRGTQMRMTFAFDGEFDSSLLRPVLPSGVKFEYLDGKGMVDGEGGEFLKGLEDFGRQFGDKHDGGSHDEVIVDTAVIKR